VLAAQGSRKRSPQQLKRFQLTYSTGYARCKSLRDALELARQIDKTGYGSSVVVSGLSTALLLAGLGRGNQSPLEQLEKARHYLLSYARD